MAIYEQKPWVNPIGKMTIFQLFELLVFVAQKSVFSFQNIVKDIFLPILPKKKCQKWPFLDQNPRITPLEYMWGNTYHKGYLFSREENTYHQGYVFPRQGNTYHQGYVFPHLGNTYHQGNVFLRQGNTYHQRYVFPTWWNTYHQGNVFPTWWNTYHQGNVFLRQGNTYHQR